MLRMTEVTLPGYTDPVSHPSPLNFKAFVLSSYPMSLSKGSYLLCFVEGDREVFGRFRAWTLDNSLYLGAFPTPSWQAVVLSVFITLCFRVKVDTVFLGQYPWQFGSLNNEITVINLFPFETWTQEMAKSEIVVDVGNTKGCLLLLWNWNYHWAKSLEYGRVNKSIVLQFLKCFLLLWTFADMFIDL